MKHNLNEYQRPKIEGDNLDNTTLLKDVADSLIEYNFVDEDEENLSDNFIKQKKQTLID